MSGHHTRFPVGTRCRIKLRNGEVIIDQFKERKSKFLVFNNHKLTPGEIISCSIIKGLSENSG